ncbi:MAG TPA: hypothetical protein VIG40_02255 [Tissierellaceae bacterium]
MDKISKKLNQFAEVLELILAVIIGIAVVIGIGTAVKNIFSISNLELITYDSFKEFLSYILILVIGVEFILMLLTHSATKITQLVVFVIARKMLIYGHNMLDMLLGSLAVAVIFGTLKFFSVEDEQLE